MPCILKSLAPIADQYDVLLCDVWGVVHDGRAAFPGPCSALARWRAVAGPVAFISNSPRRSGDVARQLDEVGVPRDAWSFLVTSGDVTRTLLAARAPGPTFAIGPERDQPLYDGLGLAFAPLAEATFISCTGLFDDETETPEDYRALLTEALGRHLPMICANPDRRVQRGDRLIWCAGGLADLYESLGGEVTMAGKPHAPIYAASLARAGEALARPLERDRVLAVGDGVATDLAGAAAQGLDALFVAMGIHAAETLNGDGSPDPEAISALLGASGLAARYAMAELAW